MLPEFTELTCDACGTRFQRRAANVRKERKRGRLKSYCSIECRVAGQRTQIELVCDLCGSKFMRYRSEIAKSAQRNCHRVICSKDCERRWNAANAVDLRCPYCAKQFTVWPSRVKHNIGKGQEIFCSEACRNTASGLAARNQVEVTCFVCGRLHKRIPARVRKHNFCSPECQSIGVATWASGRRTAIDLPCETCGAMVYRRPHQFKHRTYCSRSCANAGLHTQLDHGWAKSGVRTDLGHMCRSSWEANICRVFKAMGIAYEYEPFTFRVGDSRYTPDLRIANYWIEIKGWLKPKAAAKLTAFREKHPEEILVMLEEPMYRVLEREWSPRIPEWEFTTYQRKSA